MGMDGLSPRHQRIVARTRAFVLPMVWAALLASIAGLTEHMVGAGELTQALGGSLFFFMAMTTMLMPAGGGDTFLTDAATAEFVTDAIRARVSVALIVWHAGTGLMSLAFAVEVAARMSGMAAWAIAPAHDALKAGAAVMALGALWFWAERWRVRHAALLA